MKQVKITGNWNGQPIWREETAEETLRKNLLPELEKAEIGRKKQNG